MPGAFSEYTKADFIVALKGIASSFEEFEEALEKRTTADFLEFVATSAEQEDVFPEATWRNFAAILQGAMHSLSG